MIIPLMPCYCVWSNATCRLVFSLNWSACMLFCKTTAVLWHTLFSEVAVASACSRSSAVPLKLESAGPLGREHLAEKQLSPTAFDF